MSEIKLQRDNIDEQGNVLYLDEDLLKKKEVPSLLIRTSPMDWESLIF